MKTDEINARTIIIALRGNVNECVICGKTEKQNSLFYSQSKEIRCILWCFSLTCLSSDQNQYIDWRQVSLHPP